jgi:hypothetical protein
MEQFGLLKSAADLMLADMIKGQPDLKELNFNIDFFGAATRCTTRGKPLMTDRFGK